MIPAFQEALALQEQGRLVEAARLYRRVLGQRPDSIEAHYNLANTLKDLGRSDEAIAHYGRAIALAPDYAPAHNNLGNTLQSAGHHEDAIRSYRRALAIDPDHAEAHNNLGVVLQALDRHEEAVTAYRRACAAKPDFAFAYNNLGNAYEALGLHRQALAAYEAALAVRPGFAEAHCNLGGALHGLGRFAEAAAACERAVALTPDHAEAHNKLGAALRALGRRDEALAHYERALAIEPGNAAAHNNLGNLLQALNRFDEAIACYGRALAIKPDYAEALSHLGIAFKALNRSEDALACQARALAIKPDYPEAQLNDGLLRLAMGDFARGWRQYEWRWRSGGWGLRRRAVEQPVWLGGEDPAGKTILLYAEQGFGDTLQFVRYAPLLARRGARVVLEVQPSLVELMSSLDGVAAVRAQGEMLPAYDRHCPMSSLPLAFGTTVASVPADIPYLTPPATATARWRAEITAGSGPRVGLVWAGNPDHNNDHNRSIPLRCLQPLLALPGIAFFALQQVLREGDAQALEAFAGVTPLGGRLADFSDAAAVVSMLDLVITVDTAVAHLAGALGKDVWIMLPFSPEWRWLRGHDDSPWYPTARLFRQEAIGDWAGVVRRVAAALEARAAALPT